MTLRPFPTATTALVFLLFLLSLTPLHAAPTDLPGWKLTFDDEFNGSTLDLSKWTPQDPWGRERNQELQAYVTTAFEIKDGILHVKAEPHHAFYDGRNRDYTSGMMTTYGKFSQQCGRFEIRCRIPAGRGLWPAFWLLPDPLDWPPEIDVLEMLGHEPNKIHMTQHWMNPGHQHKSQGGSWSGPDFSKDFHTFAVEWTPEKVIWLVDGIERAHSASYSPHTKMYLLINLAVGGDWPKSPDDTTHFPASLDVDYVRVYEKLP